ncbi:hypothetical protein ACJMK2_013653 [Sinanodonta woodiana]|uniref:peptidylprolyl isomerase n=1 Tax=Sinanodonta woodiana TaxID=1069815 RepID=A0ABD3UYT1_SINWO
MMPVVIFKTLCIFLCLTVSVFGQEDGELKIEILSSPEAECTRKTKKNDIVTMHYTGTLLDGTKFDSSYERQQPFQFQIGIGQVIKGWEQGLIDMCVGEKRKLTIPPHLAYGDQGAGDKIPPKSTLVFEIELINAADGPAPPNVFKEVDSNKDNALSMEEISDYLIQNAKRNGQQADVNSEDHKNIIKTIFEHEDKDKDGVISHEEFSGPKHDEL